MLFFNKKNKAINQFEKEYLSFPKALRDEIDKIITATGYLMKVVEDTLFPELKRIFSISTLTNEVEDLVYCFLISKMTFPGKERFYFIASPIIYLRGMKEVSKEKAENMIPLNNDEIDKDPEIAYIQLMTKVYAFYNKEYTDQEEEKAKNFRNKFFELADNFMSGCLKGITQSPISDIQNKAKIIREDLNDTQLTVIKLFAVLSTNKL